MNKLVSVIIPVYNREEFIEEAIQSVFNQTYRPIECIVVDDGSTDQSVAVVEKLIFKFLDNTDFIITLIKQENAGAPAARNKGIVNANGEFFQFLDSDDLLYPNKIQSQMNLLLENAYLDGVYGDWHKGTLLDKRIIKGEKWDDIITQFYVGNPILTFSFLLRKNIIEKIGYWDVNLKCWQDIDYFLRAAIAGGKFEYLENVTGLWRSHTGNRISNFDELNYLLEFHDKYLKKFESLGIFTRKLKEIAAYNLFWLALDLKSDNKNKALNYLNKAFLLYPGIPEFNSPKMRLLRLVLGRRLSVFLWYHKTKNSLKL